MPLPALPALTAAARFLLSRGPREAVKKYGKAVVKKAKELIKKRDQAINLKREQLPREADAWRRSPAEQRAVDIKSGAARRTRSLRTQAERGGGEYVPKEEIPLKLKKGGKVRGDGIAQRGHTKGRVV